MRALVISDVAAALLAQAPVFEVATIKPSLKRVVMGAYRLGPTQIAGGPVRWVIAAKADHPAGDSELMQMLQALLADHFQLKTHRETRPMNAFVLEVAKGGHKLKPSTTEGSRTSSGRGRLDAQPMTMAAFAELLSRQTDLPVVDRTGLDGAFDLLLEWTLDRDRPAKDGPALPTALQEQFGPRAPRPIK